MAAATIALKLNDKGQATPEDALRAAMEIINAVKIDYSGMTEEQIGRLRRLAASVNDNAMHLVSRSRREFADQTSTRR